MNSKTAAAITNTMNNRITPLDLVVGMALVIVVLVTRGF